MDVLGKIKSGSRVMVNLSNRNGGRTTYNLTDGSNVSEVLFLAIRPFLRPSDSPLFPDAEPQSYEWGG